MANDERDRLGDKLKDVERAREDRYFAEQDKRLLEKMRQAGGDPDAATASMQCPKCGTGLKQDTIEGVEVDICPGCNGMWLDDGELRKIARREDTGWLARWLRTP
ncbi:MAG TPA: zf-TFIIB domain-containing protein [Terriglobales bacterium]|nr:zf-TFIIB domain-containing protein [Terriglobales bacterium]